MDELVRVRGAGRADRKTVWGQLTQRAPESALVSVKGEDPTWYPWRNVMQAQRAEVNDDGTRTLHFEDGARIIEGETELPGED